MAAAKPTDETPDVPSQESGLRYLVKWQAVSVHIGDNPEPITVPHGEWLPDEAADQGPFFKSIGAVEAFTRK